MGLYWRGEGERERELERNQKHVRIISRNLALYVWYVNDHWDAPKYVTSMPNTTMPDGFDSTNGSITVSVVSRERVAVGVWELAVRADLVIKRERADCITHC